MINIGQFQSVRICVSEAPSFEDCDQSLISELERIKIPLNEKIKQAIQWEEKDDGQ